MIKKIVTAVFFILLFLPHGIFAAEDSSAQKNQKFATSYEVLYDVDEAGVTTVTEKVNLKNLTSEDYATQFKLTFGASQIYDIKASDEGGSLETNLEQKDNLTSINVKFNQQVAGLGKNLSWTISFKSKDFAEKTGKIWEVRAPRISPTTNPESYNLTLSVPKSFGEPSQISPTPKSQTVSGNKLFLTFDMVQLKSSGISANFGQNQLFDFDLTYHLENNNLTNILTTIALPPDTSYQDVVYQRIDPKPINVTLDTDGNYLAWYRLSRAQKLDVKVFGSAKLYSKSKVKAPVLEDNLRKLYIQADKYWEKDNPQILSKLNEILGENPSSADGEKAKLIFRFVVDYLKYDSTRLKDDNLDRMGAVTALNNPDSAVCMEFTDLFIALARAAGIPARELNGYAYSGNSTLRPLSLTKDILHSWPEYWDQTRGWIMIDPTWENTTGGADYFDKLDLNHFVFVIKGSSSQKPVPAGSYKYKDQDTQDVKVSLSETDFLGKPQIDVQINTSSPIWSGFPAKASIKITNTGNSFFPSDTFSINAGNLLILPEGNEKLGVIPPFGNAEFEYSIRTKSFFEPFNDRITVLVGKQKFSREVLINPFILFQTVPIMVIGISILMVILYGVILGVFIYRKRFLKATQKTGKS